MALKDQPYFPFYVKDFNDDDQLKECDAEAHGVYIRIMCLMHKSKSYGRILLEQKYQQEYQQTKQQKESMCTDFVGAFAIKLKRHLPFSLLEIERGLCQLIENDVIKVDGNTIYQKRMVKDGKISEVRASAGRKSASGKGGRNNFVGTNAPTNEQTNELTNNQQNTAIAIAIENRIDNKGGIDNTKGVQGGEKLGGEEERDFYVGNWHLEVEVDVCLKYFIKDIEFEKERKECLERFWKQGIELPDDELVEKLEAWGRKFNSFTSGDQPKRNMRGNNSWVQHFKNYFNKRDLTENPLKESIIKKKDEMPGQTLKTTAQLLKERK